jgi:hypothetical protein
VCMFLNHPNLTHTVCRNFFDSVHVPWGELSMGIVVRGAKCPWGELSLGRIVLGANCPWGEMSVGRNVCGANRGRNVRGARCHGASCRGASFNGVSCPGAICLGASGPGTSIIIITSRVKNSICRKYLLNKFNKFSSSI